MADPENRHEVDDPVMAIGVLAHKVGLSVSAVRKYEREELGLNIEGIRRMQSLLPCWDLLPCSEDARRVCPGQKDASRPCWMIKGLPCAPKGNECRQCVVYRFGSLCTQDIKRLLFEENGLTDGGTTKLERLVQMRVHGESAPEAESEDAERG